MRIKKEQAGFTLIETLLFLAISGILVVIVLVTMGPRIRNVRFSTGMNDMAEHITSEFSAANFGRLRTETQGCTVDSATGNINLDVSDTSRDRGTQGDCIIIGKIVGVRIDKLDYYDVIARREPRPGVDCTAGLKGIIDCYSPRAARAIFIPVDVDGDEIELEFGQQDRSYEYKSGIRNYKHRNLVFGSVQNPNGAERYQFFWNGSFPDMRLVYGPGGSVRTGSSSSIPYDYIDGRNGHACFELSGRRAALIFDVQRTAPELVFGEEDECQ